MDEWVHLSYFGFLWLGCLREVRICLGVLTVPAFGTILLIWVVLADAKPKLLWPSTLTLKLLKSYFRNLEAA